MTAMNHNLSVQHSPGHSSGGMHLPLCTTYVVFSQLQPGKQANGQIGLWSQHVPSHPLHSLSIWPSIGHSVWLGIWRALLYFKRKLPEICIHLYTNQCNIVEVNNHFVPFYIVSRQGLPGHSSGGMHLPLCTTYVKFAQLQPGKQINGQIGFGFKHVPSQPLHSL